jgi:acyl carrier protein
MTQDLVTRERIDEETRKAVAETLGIDDPDSIDMDASLTEDLGAQSLDFLDINFRLEQTFGIKMARHFVLEHVQEEFGEGKAINEDGEVTSEAVRLLKLRMGEDYPVEEGDLIDDLPALVSARTFADAVEKILESLPEEAPGGEGWKTEDGTHIVDARTGEPAPFKTGDELIIEWLHDVQDRESIF